MRTSYFLVLTLVLSVSAVCALKAWSVGCKFPICATEGNQTTHCDLLPLPYIALVAERIKAYTQRGSETMSTVASVLGRASLY